MAVLLQYQLILVDAARRLNVSRSVVHRLWNQYRTEASVFRRHVPGQRRSTPTGDHFFNLLARRRRRISVLQLVADHSVASGRRISANTIVEEYLEGLGLERMEWPARSLGLNPIEYLWDYLGRSVAALSPPPRSLGELEQSLLRVWSSLPISVIDNLIDSMEI
ncbi:transposable element Tcb2 transposase [Trichonephila clavipes]|nr:transposable element Tcb2 transposase [Trichonephila clavipes]